MKPALSHVRRSRSRLSCVTVCTHQVIESSRTSLAPYWFSGLVSAMAQEFHTTCTIIGPGAVPRAALLAHHSQIIGFSTHRNPALTAADIGYQDSSQLKWHIALKLVPQHAAAAKALFMNFTSCFGTCGWFRVWCMQDCTYVPRHSPDIFAHRNLRILMAFGVCVDKALKKFLYAYSQGL